MYSHSSTPHILIGLSASPDDSRDFVEKIPADTYIGFRPITNIPWPELASFSIELEKEKEARVSLFDINFLQNETEKHLAIHNAGDLQKIELLEDCRATIKHVIRINNYLVTDTFSKTTDRLQIIDHDPDQMTSSEILFHLAKGADSHLVIRVNTKLKILCYLHSVLNKFFENFPREIIFNQVGNFYIQSEFKKQPLSFGLFVSEKNRKQPEFLPERPPGMNNIARRKL